MSMYKESVNQEDVHVTEAQISGAFSRLKRSIVDIPGQVSKPVVTTVKEHPFASMAAAAGAGIIVHQVIKASQPKVIVKEVDKGSGKKSVTKSIVGDVTSQLLTQLLPLAAPYLAAILEKEMTKMLTAKK